MRRLLIICCALVLAFIGIYQDETSPIAYTTEQQDESPSRTQDESENERQFEEQIILLEQDVSRRTALTTQSYFIGNTSIPDTPPIPLRDPPPNQRS